jgi:DNA repair protein RadC
VLAPPKKPRLFTPTDAYAHLYPYLAGRESEQFVVIAIDIRHQVLATTVVAEGAPNAVRPRMADVFAVAVRHRAVAIVVAHNHPSEVVQPSLADHDLTKTLVEAGALLGIPVLDHLVICGESFWGLVQNTGEIRVPIIQATP